MKRIFILHAIALVALLMGISTANAQRSHEPSAPHSGYDLSWYTIDGGGATFSTGGSYSFGGSIGQPDAGVWSGGSYSINSGFWGESLFNYDIYLPLVMKNT